MTGQNGEEDQVGGDGDGSESHRDPRHHIVVALEGSCVVGMASGVHYVHPDKAAQLFVNEVGVAPTHHRQGIGRKLVVAFLKKAPSPRDVKSLQASIDGPERVRAHGKQAYLLYPNGIGRSRLTAKVIEKALGGRCTARNWNTVRKIEAAARGSGSR